MLKLTKKDKISMSIFYYLLEVNFINYVLIIL